MFKKKYSRIYSQYFLILFCLICFSSPAYAEGLGGNLLKIKNFGSASKFPEITDLYTTTSEVSIQGVNQKSEVINSSDIDISGFWTGQVSSQYGAATMNFYLIQSGSTVTGTWKSSGTYSTGCGPWTGTVSGNVSDNLFSFDGSSPTKDLNTCEVICLDTLNGTLTINGNKMIGNGTDVDCEDGEVYNMTISLEFSYNPKVSFLDKDNPSREVIGTAADGSSAAVIQISGLAKDVTLSDIQINVDQGDGDIDNDATILNGVYTVTYHAPEYFVRDGHPEDISQGKRPIGLTIIVNGEDAVPPPFYLTKPPVVLLHGLWADQSTWDKLKAELETNYGYNPNYILAFQYTSYLSFDLLSWVIDTAIKDTLSPAVNDGFVAKKADIVAHSMGGVIAKLYGQKSNINSITTVGTPHFGSPLADILWSFVNGADSDPFKKFIADLFLLSGHPITYGAIEDLRTTLNVQANQVDVPNYVIVGISPLTDQINIELINLLAYVFKLYGLLPMTADLLELNQIIFNGERNDWVVSESSQRGGLLNAEVDNVLWHLAEPTDEEVLTRIIGFLHRTGPLATASETKMFKNQASQRSEYILPAIRTNMSSGQVKIMNPVEGQNVKPGDTVNIEINISSENSVVIMVTSTGESALIDHSPYIFQFVVPNEVVGQLTIMVGARDDTGFIGSDKVTIDVSSVANLIDVKVYPEISPLSLPPGASIPLSIYGSYDDNVTRDITSSGCGTTYVSSIPDVAEVTSEGLITVKSLGQTTITVTNSGVSREMTVIGELTVLQGTVGTRFTLQGSGFGSQKPTVYVEYEKTPGITKKVSAKVESYSDTSITCLWTNTLPPGTYNLKVLPKAKGSAPISMDTFSIQNPVINGVAPNTGKVADKITINGMFFSSKKPKVYLEDPSTLKRKSLQGFKFGDGPRDRSKLTSVRCA